VPDRPAEFHVDSLETRVNREDDGATAREECETRVQSLFGQQARMRERDALVSLRRSSVMAHLPYPSAFH
jgi:hypothetical protein